MAIRINVGKVLINVEEEVKYECFTAANYIVEIFVNQNPVSQECGSKQPLFDNFEQCNLICYGIKRTFLVIF